MKRDGFGLMWLSCIGEGHVSIMPTSQWCVYGTNIRSAKMFYKAWKYTLLI